MSTRIARMEATNHEQFALMVGIGLMLFSSFPALQLPLNIFPTSFLVHIVDHKPFKVWREQKERALVWVG